MQGSVGSGTTGATVTDQIIELKTSSCKGELPIFVAFLSLAFYYIYVSHTKRLVKYNK